MEQIYLDNNRLTKEELEEIKRLAGLFFTPREIAIMLEKDVTSFITLCEMESDIATAFQCGRLQREVDLRSKIIKLAESGSSPAQTMAMDMLKKSQIKMIDR